MKQPRRSLRRSPSALACAATFIIGVGMALAWWLSAGRAELGSLFANQAWAENATAKPGAVAPVQTPEDPATPGEDDSTQQEDADTSQTREAESSTPLFANDPMEKLAATLKERERKLDEREAALKREEQRLEALRKETEQNLAQIDLKLKEMQTIAGEAAQKHQQELGKWIKIYQAMEPEKVGKIIEGLETPFAVELLSQMEPKKAGKILGFVSPDKSIELSQKLNAQHP